MPNLTQTRPTSGRVNSLLNGLLLCTLAFTFAFTLTVPKASSAQERRFTHDDFLKAFPKPVASKLAEAEQLYAARCVQCHGSKGQADGVLSRKMSPRPRNLRSRAWFESLDYPARIKRLKRSIIGGGPAVGGSALMPPNPDLRNKPELLYALVYYLALPHKPSPIVEQEPVEDATGALQQD